MAETVATMAAEQLAVERAYVAMLYDRLDELRADFPGVTIPKIRFLEDKGLIKPERTQAGYRKFSSVDVDRLVRDLQA